MSGCFKFSLVEQKENMLAEAPRKATDFICATDICAGNSDASKKARIQGDKNLNRGDRNPNPGERRPLFKAIDPRFTTDARSILMEVRGHTMTPGNIASFTSRADTLLLSAES